MDQRNRARYRAIWKPRNFSASVWRRQRQDLGSNGTGFSCSGSACQVCDGRTIPHKSSTTPASFSRPKASPSGRTKFNAISTNVAPVVIGEATNRGGSLQRPGWSAKNLRHSGRWRRSTPASAIPNCYGNFTVAKLPFPLAVLPVRGARPPFAPARMRSITVSGPGAPRFYAVGCRRLWAGAPLA